MQNFTMTIFAKAREYQEALDAVAKVRAQYPILDEIDDPWEGPPKYNLRCYHCGMTHPECGFYPIMGIMGPGTHGREMQLCLDCDKHLREASS